MNADVRWLWIGVLLTSSVAGLARGDEPVISGWGRLTDPGDDCTLIVDARRLTLGLPASPQDLSCEIGSLGAPRLLTPVSGSVIATVQVSGDFVPEAPSLIPGRRPYQAAGLLLWQDEANYFRMERACVLLDDGPRHVVSCELRHNGKTIAQNRSIGLPASGAFYLRLERRGGMLHCQVSQNGWRWIPVEPITDPLTGTLQVGVHAINSGSDPFDVELQGLEIYQSVAREEHAEPAAAPEPAPAAE